GYQIDHILGPAVDFRVPLLPAIALDLGDRQAGYPDFGQRLPHIAQAKGLDDCNDQFHAVLLGARSRFPELKPGKAQRPATGWPESSQTHRETGWSPMRVHAQCSRPYG